MNSDASEGPTIGQSDKQTSGTSEPPRGVEHAGVIDMITHDAKRGEVTLVMVEPRPWDGSELRLFQLQEKLNAYVSFALDGELAEAYPKLAGLPLRLLLECATYPDNDTVTFLERVREQLGFQQIDLQVLVKEKK